MNNRLKECRINAGLSQKYVAACLHIKAPSVCNWESGKNSPTNDKLIELSKLYGVPVEYLLGGEAETPETKKEPDQAKPEIELSEEEKKLISLYRSLSDRNRARAYSYLEGAAGSEENLPSRNQ